MRQLAKLAYVLLMVFILMITLVIGCTKSTDEEDKVDNTPPAQPSNPRPSNGAIAQSVEANLHWECSDPDLNDRLHFQVYFKAGDPDPDSLLPIEVYGSQYDLGTLAPNVTYYWRVIAIDNHGASAQSPVWSFTTSETPNTSPNQPSNPEPANGVTGVDVETYLNWDCSDPDPGDQLFYDVYLDDDTTNGFNKVASLLTGTTQFDPIASLDSSKTYYWKIVAFDDLGADNAGPVWSFTTVTLGNNAPNTPTIYTSGGAPDSGQVNIDINANLSWLCSDPDDDDLTYNVYFGTSNPPGLVSNHQTSSYYEPGELAISTTYFWRIVAYDTHGDSSSSSLWNFTTGTSDAFVIYCGNPNGQPITTSVGTYFDVDLYFYTRSDVNIGDILICIGANKEYVDTLASNEYGEILYPFDEWDSFYYNDIYEYRTGWFNEPFLGWYDLISPYDAPPLHFDIPTVAIKLKMKASDNPSLAGQTVDAFEFGEDPYQGPSNVGDISGGISYTVTGIFNQLRFTE